MAALPSGPKSCFDPTCRGRHAPDERIALAASLCDARSAQLTAIRRQVLELLWEARRPIGAYELMDALKNRNTRPVGPPTVYRALDFLIAQGLVVKVESRNAYVPCAHPERQHGCLLFVCQRCGASDEIEDPRFEALLADDAAALGYQVVRRIIEVEGVCPICVETHAA